ncbi:MAG: deoxyribonuclease V [Gammaproteobacteria bacterium]
MQPPFIAPHAWTLSVTEARAIQERLRSQIILQDQFDEPRWVAGIDVGFEANNTVTRAAVAVLSFPALQLVEAQISRLPTAFPYIPGYLSFREAPAVLAAMNQLQHIPDLLLCDGQGIAHPRRFGIACHLGLITGIAAIGVAKSRLCGQHGEIPRRKGQWTPLREGDDTIGAVLRSREGVKPLYVSPGHKICCSTAVKYTMACITRVRLPETTRWAHKLASGAMQ